MPIDDRVALLEAIAVTAELTGAELSEPAARMMATDLAQYPLEAVLSALTRCRRELKTRLTLAAVLERIDDGRPDGDEAWAMIPQDEAGSCVWTAEMAAAWGVAAPLIETDRVGARMAFKDAYTRLVNQARADRTLVHWVPSLGHDVSGRERVIEEAVRLGRIGAAHAQKLLPHYEPRPAHQLATPTAVGKILGQLRLAGKDKAA